jgi:hypothetical protein
LIASGTVSPTPRNRLATEVLHLASPTGMSAAYLLDYAMMIDKSFGNLAINLRFRQVT